MTDSVDRKLTKEWLLRRWAGFAHTVSLVGEVGSTGMDLLERYTESHRRYHGVEHIRECLELLDTVAGLAKDVSAIEAAIWFHDAVYEGNDQDVLRSADLAREVLTHLGAPAEWAETVHALVITTEHAVVPDNPDAMVLCDIDLWRLAAAPERFDANTEALREEANMTEAEFDPRRKAFLRTMLRREFLFSTDHFRRTFEPAARANMERALACDEQGRRDD